MRTTATLALAMIVWTAPAGRMNAAEAGEAAIVKAEFVYEQASFRSCHASTIAESQGGLVAAWFGGTREGAADVGIWCSRHDGKAWSPPVEAANGVQEGGKRHPCWNPVLFQWDKTLHLFYKVGPSPRTWWGMLITSTDGGRTWSRPQRLPDGFAGPIKNKPVLEGGRLLCPSSTEDAGWRVHMESWTGKEGGWSKTDPLNDGKTIGAIQPSILRLGGEKLLALGRTRQGKIFQIASEDRGKTWGEMTLTSLPNPNSGIDAVTLADGRHLVVYNHTARGRSPLNVSVSRDGQAWQAALTLEDLPGEYSYPAVIQAADGRVHATYTWKRQKVRHVVIDPTRLVLRELPGGQWPQ